MGRASISPVMRGVLLERFNRTCYYCNKRSESYVKGPDGESWHIDHIVPVARGGGSEETNLVLACCCCNSSKSDWLYDPAWEGSRGGPPHAARIRRAMRAAYQIAIPEQDPRLAGFIRCARIGQALAMTALEVRRVAFGEPEASRYGTSTCATYASHADAIKVTAYFTGVGMAAISGAVDRHRQELDARTSAAS